MNLNQGIEIYFSELIKDVEAGDISALRAFASASDLQRLCSDALEKIKPYALKDAEAFNESTFTEAGRKFTKVPSRRMVKYDHIPQWADLKTKQSRIEKLALTAALEFGATIVDDETGEVIPPAELNYTKPSISVK